MSYKPLHDNILIELESNENATTSGIVINQEKQKDRGVVLAVGPVADEVKVGDRIIFLGKDAEEVSVMQVIVNESSVLCIIE